MLDVIIITSTRYLLHTLDCTNILLFFSNILQTTTKFLIDAALEGKSDHLDGPSGRIVVGRVGGYGTGCFDLRLPVPTKVGRMIS